jgi:Ca2+-binding RTX toxin-like protein
VATRIGSIGDDILTGTAADDELIDGGAGNDTLRGLAGQDRLVGGPGIDILDGGDNLLLFGDIADYSSSASSPVMVDLIRGLAEDGLGGLDALIGIENIIGANFSDTLLGDNGPNGFRGSAGNDILDGRGGEDVASYFLDPMAVNIDLETGIGRDGYGGTDTLRNIENVNGSAFADTLRGNGGRNVFQGYNGNDILDGRGGTDMVNYDSVTVTSAVTVNLLLGAASDGLGGTDTLISIEDIQGSPFADTLTGDNGRNLISGLNGDDIISGGLGIDTSAYTAARGSYNLSRSAGTITVTDRTPARDGMDTLTGIERLNFTDGTLAFDNLRTDDAGKGYLIYRAAFDRMPDVEGLGYWIRELERGQDYGAVVAASFIASPEFINLYGTSLSNTAFVNLVYQNVLDRAADADGLNYWLSQAGGVGLNGGYARSNLLASFAISDENYNSVSPLISDGIFFV